MAVIGADYLEAGTHIFVKLRPCIIRKSTRHCPGRECHFESERQDVKDNLKMVICIQRKPITLLLLPYLLLITTANYLSYRPFKKYLVLWHIPLFYTFFYMASDMELVP